MLSTMQDEPLTLVRILEHGSTVHGDSEVVTWTGGEPRRRTFRETGRRAAALAHALRDELGVQRGEAVGTLMWNNDVHLEAYLGIPAMGAVLHTLNLRLPVDQLAWIVNHAADRVVIADGSLVPLLAGVLPHLKPVEHIVLTPGGDPAPLHAAVAELRAAAGAGGSVPLPRIHDYEELIAGRDEPFPWPRMDEREAAAICYSSGTTGHPKGVVYSHRSVYLHSMQVNMAESFGLTWHDKVLPVVPMFHVNAWGMPHASFMGGVSMLMPDRFLQPRPLAEMITAERPTFSAAVPTVWSGLLDELDAHASELGHRVDSLRRVVIGGSACPPELMRGFEERYGITVVHAWGMTETSPLAAVSMPPRGPLDPETEWRYRLSQGRIPCSVRARLIGPDGEVLPHDGATAGELEVRGPWITGSYYEGAQGIADPEAEECFDDGWLRTGDVGTITPDGYLTLTDRAKDVIKSGGEWISSVALESELMGHPDVAEAAVVAVPDEKWGERPLAAVVMRTGTAADYPALRAFLADRGVAKWQLPERWTTIDEVPKTSVGKFDKKVLRGRFAHGELDVTRI